MGAGTPIRSVTNERNSAILFLNMESSWWNREVPPQRTIDAGGGWVPWCGSQNEFLSRHIAIIDTSTETVLFYIWQRRASDGDFVRASPTGFEDPGPQIAGQPEPRGDRNLRIDASGVQLNRT
jgi:hypothetical protein